MFRRRFSLVVLLVMAHVTAQAQLPRGLGKREAAPTSEAIYAGSYALLIGAEYSSAAWPPLRSIQQELQTLRAALESQGFQVTIPPAAEMTGNRIRQEVLSFISRYGLAPDNRLLIVFAGHGYTREHADRERGYLVPADAPDPARDTAGFVYSAISMDEVQSWAKMIESKHALFVFDSCFSGSIFRTRGAPTPRYLSAQLAAPVRQFLTAGSANETVPAESVFMPLFMRGLKGEADGDCDGFVTATEVYSWVSRSIAGYDVRQTPQFGKIRDPQLDQGEFLFPLPQQAAQCATRTAVDGSALAQKLDEEFWTAINGSSEPALFRHYLTRVRQGVFAGQHTAAAEARLKEIEPPPSSPAGLGKFGGITGKKPDPPRPPTVDPRAAQARVRRNLAQLIATSAAPAEGLNVDLELLRPDKGTSATKGSAQTTLRAGDRVAFKITNVGTRLAYVTLLFVDSAGRVTPIWGYPEPSTVPLEPQKALVTQRFVVTDDTVGTEEMFLIAFDSAASVERLFKLTLSGSVPLESTGISRHVAKVVSWFTAATQVP